MKKLFCLLMSCWTLMGYAQQERVAMLEADMAVDCTCQPGYSICKADGGFISCCICCEPGATCGAWQGFGLASCACQKENKPVKARIYFHPNRYQDFMDFLAKHRIENGKLTELAAKLVETRTLYEVKDNLAKSFVLLSLEEREEFSETYLAILKPLLENEDQKELIENYFNQNK